MGKMSELARLLDDLAGCGNRLAETAQVLKDFYTSQDGEATAEKPAPKPGKKEPNPAKEGEPEKTYTKEAVRAILSAKANEEGGRFKAEVKAIVKKYGNGGSLTDIDAKDYAALADEIGRLGNAG